MIEIVNKSAFENKKTNRVTRSLLAFLQSWMVLLVQQIKQITNHRQ